MRRSWVGFAVALLASLAAAQGYPDKPIRVIVSVPAGGTPDVVARMVAPGLSSLLGQQLVIDNRGGAGGLIGAELAARAAPDGYTLLFSGPSFTILPLLQKQAAYDALKDFAPVNLVSIGPYLLITHPSVAARTVSEAGVPGFEWSTWFGLVAPAKTPRQIVTRLNAALVEVVRAPDIKSQFEVLGYNAAGSSPEEFAAFIRAESGKYAKVVKLPGVKID